MKILLIIFIISGLLSLVLGTANIYTGVTSKNWDAVPARITESEVDSSRKKNRRKYRLDVAYEYQVAGNTYRSTKLSFSDYGKGSQQDAEAAQREYPLGKSLTAYVKPGSPETSVLRPGTSVRAMLLPVVGVVFVLFGFFFIRSPKNKPQAAS